VKRRKQYESYRGASSPWVPSVPTHWTVSRFGLEAAINGGQVDPREEPWRSTVLIAPNHIERDTGRLTGRETAGNQGADSGKYTVEAGQIIYSKIRPALNKAAIAIEACLCSADMYAISFRSRVHSRYAHYQVLSRPFLQFAVVASERVKMPKVNREELAGAPWLLPPFTEQRAIADYLDHETAQIDALIMKQEQLIETLRERRVAVMEQAVIEVAWTTPLRRVARLIQTGPFGSQLKSDEYVEGGVPVINPSHMVGGTVVSDSGVAVSNEKAVELSRHELRDGDLVAARRGELGRCAVVRGSTIGALCGTGSVLIRPNEAKIDAEFLALVFQSQANRDALSLASVGSTMDNLNASIIDGLKLPLPPVIEQRALLLRLDEKTAKISALIGKAERLIDVSKERRAALITAAVTGQIDVRIATSNVGEGV